MGGGAGPREFHFVAQAGLELLIFVGQLPECRVTSSHCALLVSHFKLLLLALVAAHFSGEQKSWLLSKQHAECSCWVHLPTGYRQGALHRGPLPLQKVSLCILR